MAVASLYERLGAFAIAAVVDHFSDAIVKNPIVGQQSENAQLREWHNNNPGRLPGLKFMRTLWVCTVAGGPQQYAATKPGIRRSAWKRRIANCGSRPPSSMRLRPNLGERSTSSRCQSRRRRRFSLPSPHIRAR